MEHVDRAEAEAAACRQELKEVYERMETLIQPQSVRTFQSAAAESSAYALSTHNADIRVLRASAESMSMPPPAPVDVGDSSASSSSSSFSSPLHATRPPSTPHLELLWQCEQPTSASVSSRQSASFTKRDDGIFQRAAMLSLEPQLSSQSATEDLSPTSQRLASVPPHCHLDLDVFALEAGLEAGTQ